MVAKAGYGKTRKEIKAIEDNVAKEKGTIRNKKGWFNCFMDRHPKLSLRKGDAVANVRMDCLNPDTMKQSVKGYTAGAWCNGFAGSDL